VLQSNVNVFSQEFKEIDMIAVIELGNKQYTIEKGMTFDVDLMHVEDNKTVSVDTVLLISDGKKTTVGAPHIKGATVKVKVVESGKDKKIVVFKFKRKTGYKKTQGHRQDFTRLEVLEINAKSTSSAAATKEPAEKKPTEKKTTAKKKADKE
jgi:large subunit ribosomal protein L21